MRLGGHPLLPLQLGSEARRNRSSVTSKGRMMDKGHERTDTAGASSRHLKITHEVVICLCLALVVRHYECERDGELAKLDLFTGMSSGIGEIYGLQRNDMRRQTWNQCHRHGRIERQGGARESKRLSSHDPLSRRRFRCPGQGHHRRQVMRGGL